MRKPGEPLFFDTVTLSNFALAERLDILVSRYGRRVCVVSEVMDELLDGIVAGYPALAAIESAVSRGEFSHSGAMSSAERLSYRQLLRTLASGEAACIACAGIRGGTVVTDDRAGRECCAERGVKFSGTVGILRACCRDGTLSPDEADVVLQTMISAGYHSPVRRISDILG